MKMKVEADGLGYDEVGIVVLSTEQDGTSIVVVGRTGNVERDEEGERRWQTAGECDGGCRR